MQRPSPRPAFAIALLAASSIALSASADTKGDGARPPSGGRTRTGPTVIYPLKHDLSPRLDEIARTIKNAPHQGPVEFEVDEREPIELGEIIQPAVPDPVVQDWKGEGRIPGPEVTFAGLNNDDNFATIGSRPLPPDPNGDIGPNHYFQTLNLIFAIYDRAGTRLLGPLRNNAVFAGFGGACETTNTGDPIVLYDHLADRWLLSQFGPTGAAPFHQCVAISQTADPTGQWYRYDFPIPSGVFNDYPKFGMWPDAYYVSAGSRGIPGPATDVFAYERAQMLAGGTARLVWFRTDSSLGYVAPMPADLDGPAPPVGAPNYFVGVKQSPPQALYIFRFHVDWTNPANSTFGNNNLPNDTITSVAPFTLICPSTRNCVPQPGNPPPIGLDALTGRYVMFRAQYRNYGDHESIVFNHTVDAGGQRAGVRWYEIRDPGGTPVIQQQGTYAPGDGVHRWMGSAAMDKFGNLAIGFSASSTTVFPSIYYAGRLAADPPGQLAQGEAVMAVGAGVQTSTSSRWGDYSNLTVDPTDDCTFWYTTEYYLTTSTSGWVTRVGSFRLPGCSLVPDFTVSASPDTLSVPAGTSGTSTVTVQSINGFNSLVSLSCISTSAAGVSCSFSPGSVTPPANGSASTILTLSASANARPGAYRIHVQGTSGAVTRSAPVTVTVTP